MTTSTPWGRCDLQSWIYKYMIWKHPRCMPERHLGIHCVSVHQGFLWKETWAHKELQCVLDDWKNRCTTEYICSAIQAAVLTQEQTFLSKPSTKVTGIFLFIAWTSNCLSKREDSWPCHWPRHLFLIYY